MPSDSALPNRAQLLHLFTDAVLDYAFILPNTENRVLAWNAGAEQMFGYPEAEVRGESGEWLFTPEDKGASEVEREIELFCARVG